MKYVKTLGLLALTALAAMAFAATASATNLTSPSGTTYTSSFTGKSEGKLTAHGSGGYTLECEAEGTAAVEKHGVGSTVSGKVTSLKFSNCGNATLHVKKTGTVEIHSEGSGNGSLTSSGAEVETTTESAFGKMSCIYTTNNTYLGVLTGNTSGNAMFDTAGGTIPRTGGSALCGGTATLTGVWNITSPSTLSVD